MVDEPEPVQWDRESTVDIYYCYGYTVTRLSVCLAYTRSVYHEYFTIVIDSFCLLLQVSERFAYCGLVVPQSFLSRLHLVKRTRVM